MMMNRFLQNKWAVSITAGIILGLSFPPINISVLAFPAFVLFFYLTEHTDSNKQLAYYSYAGFVVWNIITTYWLLMASIPAGIAAILANSVLMTIPLVLAAFFSRKLKSPVLIALLQATAWVSYEYLHHNWDLSWPWLALGNAWSNHVEIIQYISATGHLGISFWVVLTSALAYQALKAKNLRLAIITTSIFLLFPIISLFLYNKADSVATSETEVAVIQPNHDSYQNYAGMSGIAEVMDSLFALTERVITPTTDLVIWPENAIDGQIFLDSRAAMRISNAARTWNTAFIAGTGLIELYDTPPALYLGITGGKAYNIFNSALYVSKSGEISHYNKAHLVPVVERVPFLKFLSTIDIFNWVNWGKIGGFGKGDEPTTIIGDSFVTGGLVCYDSVYPTWIRKFIQNDAGFITIITNDGWWGNTSGHHQHFAYARLRAIEFDRWVVRSANNGISGIINPKGDIMVKTNYWERTGFIYNVPSIHTSTLYNQNGDWLSYLSLLLTFSFWAFLAIKTQMKPSET